MDRKATKGLVGGGGTDIWIAVGYRVWWWLVGFIVLAAATGPGCSSNQVLRLAAIPASTPVSVPTSMALSNARPSP